MKCGVCGADARVLETRAVSLLIMRRRYECFNGHRFKSYETHEILHPATKDIIKKARVIQQKVERPDRNKKMVDDYNAGATIKQLMETYRLDRSSVYRIVRTGSNNK